MGVRDLRIRRATKGHTMTIPLTITTMRDPATLFADPDWDANIRPLSLVKRLTRDWSEDTLRADRELNERLRREDEEWERESEREYQRALAESRRQSDEDQEYEDRARYEYERERILERAREEIENIGW